MTGHVVGLDLSLQNPAAVAIPVDWDGTDWSKLWHRTWSFDTQFKDMKRERDRIERLMSIANRICMFVKACDKPAVYVERYAFAKKFQAHQLGELGGVVKKEVLVTCNVVVEPVTASAARKLLMGGQPKSMPSKNQKAFIHGQLKKAGVPFDSGDELDAFVVANWGAGELGWKIVSLAPQLPLTGGSQTKARRTKARP